MVFALKDEKLRPKNEEKGEDGSGKGSKIVRMKRTLKYLKIWVFGFILVLIIQILILQLNPSIYHLLICFIFGLGFFVSIFRYAYVKRKMKTIINIDLTLQKST